MVSTNAGVCRVWFNGQPIICYLCRAQGHKYSECPDKDKCRLCKQVGHKVPDCANAWGTTPLLWRYKAEPTALEPADVPPPAAPGVSHMDDSPSTSNESSDTVDPSAVAEAAPAQDVDSTTSPVSHVESRGLQSSPDNEFSSQELCTGSPSVPQAESENSKSLADIGKFTSLVPSSQDSMSDFSDDSQSILQKDVSDVNAEALVALDGVSPYESESQNDERDTSVTSKRKKLSDNESSSDLPLVVEIPVEYKCKKQS